MYLSALETQVPVRRAADLERVLPVRRCIDPATAPVLGGRCIRGLVWAVVFEAISIAMLGVLAYGLLTFGR